MPRILFVKNKVGANSRNKAQKYFKKSKTNPMISLTGKGINPFWCNGYQDLSDGFKKQIDITKYVRNTL